MTVRFFVPGKPVPQGSKRWLPNNRMIEANSDLRPWRATVTAYTIKAMRRLAQETEYEVPFACPVAVVLDFTFARPKAHYGTGRNAGKVKPNAPVYVSTTPDLDKLIRAVNDGITDAGLWRDDSLVVSLSCLKQYAEQPGVTIEVIPL